MKRLAEFLEKYLFRFFAYPFCVFLILMAKRMVFDTPDYDFVFLKSKAFVSGIGSVVIASVYLVVDFFLLIKSLEKKDSRIYFATFFIIQFLLVYYFFFSDSGVAFGVNKTVGWAWDFTNFMWWLGLICVLLLVVAVYYLMRLVFNKLKK